MTEDGQHTELRLIDLIDDASIDLAFTAVGKDDAISKVVALLGASGALTDEVAFAAAVRAREAEFTTGLGDGIAIPHGKSNAVRRPAVAFARSVDGVDWQSPDGSLASLVFLIAVPEDQAGDAHLRILAMLARKLVHADFRARLTAAADAESVKEVLSEISIAL